MNDEVFYRLVKRNAKGKVVKDTGLIPIRSYVMQFLELIEGWITSTNKQATDVDGTEQYIFYSSGEANDYGLVKAPIGDDLYGVLVGTNAGVTPEANDNYKLDTKIEHSGTGEAGKMNHQATIITAPAPFEGNIDMNVSRAFINETGSTITMKEIAIYCKNSTHTKYHMLLRDVVVDQAVDDAETLTVTYTLRTTV